MVQSRRPTLRVVFYRQASGREPVREWLRSLDDGSKKIIGEDIKTVQFGWPLGMPLVRNLGDGLWEVRCNLKGGISRIIFMTKAEAMVLLHGFIKKTQKTPGKDLDLARQRAAEVRQGEQ
ncbi:MAG: type II toxin-antitoxin system RelE/ParE family toxin [Acidobacteriota bacterium]